MSGYRHAIGMETPTDPGVRLAIDVAGGTAALAAALGIKAPSIYSWTRVPAERAPIIAEKFGIKLSDLRPDLWAT
jgi:DNA-binding transcriptional regulator YdaS (Cro superfamily)